MLIPYFGFSQSENYSTAIENFKKEYNVENFSNIFDSFSPEMKDALPLEKSKQFFKGLKTQAGKIEQYDFKGFSQGTYAEYKTKFEKMTFSVNMSVGDNGKINGLFIKPFEESTKNVEITNDLSLYPKEISKIVFSRTKNFPNKTQSSIAIIKNDTTAYYGVIKTKDTIKPIENQNKIFEIGSITKVFTASVLASLVKEGKIKLSDNINKYYPFTFHNNHKITFESLANHTSGLPALPNNFDLSNSQNPYRNYDIKKLNIYLKDSLNLDNSPEKYSYSNLGAGLLAHSLGLSQKKAFKDILRDKILKKYKMENTFLEQKEFKTLVKGRNAEGGLTSNWDFDVLFGAGGILSTTEDLAKFVQAEFNPQNEELSLTQKSTFKIDDSLEIGLGWHIKKTEDKNNLYWHNGGTGGYRSIIVFDPKAKNAIIILSNVSAFNQNNENIDKLGFDLINEEINK